MISFKVDKCIKKRRIKIKDKNGHKIPIIVLSNKNQTNSSAGILWMHGGGYMTGMKEMVYFSRAINLVKRYSVVVISPGYRLSLFHPYPKGLEDCYEALLFMKNNADELKINKNQIMVGGESAGGGLAAALAIYARDKGEVNICYQMLLYPMLDNLPTESNLNNHGKIWNSRRNNAAWRMYLRDRKNDIVESYASPSRETNYTNLPPAYAFVGDKEPFYSETVTYIYNLNKANIDAKIDVYDTNIHAFDMLYPKLDISKKAIINFENEFEYALKHYYNKN